MAQQQEKQLVVKDGEEHSLDLEFMQALENFKLDDGFATQMPFVSVTFACFISRTWLLTVTFTVTTLSRIL